LEGIDAMIARMEWDGVIRRRVNSVCEVEVALAAVNAG